MSVIAGVARAAGAKVLTGRTSARKILPTTKGTLVVIALALLALATLISASETVNVGHSPAASSTNSEAAAAPVSQPAAPQMSEEAAIDAYGKLPLSFISNEGQITEEAVRYYAQGAGYGFFFTKGGATLSFAKGKGRGGHALALDFLGADPDATLTAKKRLSGEVNYLIGDDSSEWQQGLAIHAELLYGGLWPGIDMAVRGEGGDLKYEFHLKPGSSVKDVRLGYRGAEGLRVGAGGQLLVQTPLGVLKDVAPVSYQRIGGERVPVESRYVLKGDGGYGFAVGAYDPRYPLVIDPGLDYSTFLGAPAGVDIGESIAVRDGRAYVTGETQFDYPTTPGAFDRTFDGDVDVFVTKLNASGSKLDYSTFLGGTNPLQGEREQGFDIAVDGRGRAYVTGRTDSPDYPTTRGAFDRTFNCSEGAFVTKLNPAGSKLDYSTFLGGGDIGFGIAVREGRAYVTGDTRSSDFPTTRGAFDRTFNGNFSDAFVTKLNASGSKLDYSTFLGGTSDDSGSDIAVDGNARAYVTGGTDSTGFPTTRGTFDTSFNGGTVDVFVTKLNAAGSALDYSTFLGGAAFDRGRVIALDRRGKAYVTGETSSADHPTTPGAFDTSFNGLDDAFVTKLNASGSALAYSTFLGGTSYDEGRGIALDRRGKAYVTGYTISADFPTTPGAFDTSFNGGPNDADAFVAKLPTG